MEIPADLLLLLPTCYGDPILSDLGIDPTLLFDGRDEDVESRRGV
jgi:hypothetical protein